MVFESKVDLWIICVLFFSVISTVIIGVAIHNQTWVGAIICYLTALVTLIIFLLLGWPCKYSVNPKGLSIKCGMIYNINIKLEDIRYYKYDKRILAAPALSLDRVMLFDSDKNHLVTISPKNKQLFIDKLIETGSNVTMITD